MSLVHFASALLAMACFIACGSATYTPTGVVSLPSFVTPVPPKVLPSCIQQPLLNESTSPLMLIAGGSLPQGPATTFQSPFVSQFFDLWASTDGASSYQGWSQLSTPAALASIYSPWAYGGGGAVLANGVIIVYAGYDPDQDEVGVVMWSSDNFSTVHTYAAPFSGRDQIAFTTIPDSNTTVSF